MNSEMAIKSQSNVQLYDGLDKQKFWEPTGKDVDSQKALDMVPELE